MTSFDALRASHVGAVSYLCKKQPPEDLLGLWTFQGSLADLSRYKRDIITSTTPSYGTGGIGTYVTNLTAGIDISLDGDFTLEAFAVYGDPRASVISIGNHGLGCIPYNYGNSVFEWYFNGTNQSSLSYGSDFTTLHHVALVRCGSTVKYYLDGNYRKSVSDSSVINIFNITTIGTNARLQNLRLVKKALTTGSNFPIPAGIYTGYEPL